MSAIQDRVQAFLRHPAWGPARPPGAVTVARSDAGFRYEGPRLATHVTLPANAAGPTTISRHEGALRIRLQESRAESEGAIASGTVIYPGALGPHIDVLHRPLASGGDDELVYFGRRPAKSAVSYAIDAPTGVVALALRGRSVEAVGFDGRSIFHMRAPFLIDADGQRREVAVKLRGCDSAAFRRDRLGCRMQLTWSEAVHYPAVLDPEWTATGGLAYARGSHTATRLDDGRVLVTGGVAWDFIANDLAPIADAEIYEPLSGVWTTTGAMVEARTGHTALLMPNGKVLVAGGRDANASLDTAEIFDPATETWSAASPMAGARSGHDMIEAWNWAPMVAGGFLGATALSTTEVFDALTNTWTSVGNLATPRGLHRLAELPGKQILAISGRSFTAGWTPSIELYDPATELWTFFANLTTARIDHTATRLRDGRILVTGGVSSSGQKLASAEFVSPSGTVAAAPSMAAARYAHTATLLQSGKVLVVGGECDTPTCTERSEEYDPALNVWAPSVSIYQHPALRYHASTLLEDGRVVSSGGLNLTLGPYEDSTYATGSLYDGQRCKPPGLAGVVVGSISAAPATVDLTAEGETDWLYETEGSINRKLGPGLVTPLSTVGASTRLYGYGNTTYDWTDGDPFLSRTTTENSLFSGLPGDGYSISFPTSPELRIAKLRLGAVSGAGLLHVELSGNACSSYETVVRDPEREVNLLFMSPNPGDVLTARFTLLEPGELSAEGMTLRPAPLGAMTFETDEDPTKSDFIVTVDNPLASSALRLELQPTVWGGIQPETVTIATDGFSNQNADFSYLASNGEGNPKPNNTAPADAGSLNDTLFSWPNTRPTTFAAATADDRYTAQARGLRVGYAPLTVQPRNRLPDDSVLSTGPSTSVKLDPSVLLVPIQVIVVYSNTYPRRTDLRDQLMLFDQVHEPATSVFTDGATQERLGTLRGFEGLPWMNPDENGLYNVIGFDTPDSAWRSCGIQFRLVNYFEKYTDKDKYVLPSKADRTITPEDPDFDRYYSKTAPDGTPCAGTLNFVGTNEPRFLSGVLPVIYMERSGFSDSLEDGRAVDGGVCVRRGAPRNSLAHEIGHIMLAPPGSAFADDCPCGTVDCKMLCTVGGGSSPPTASECTRARTWAQSRSSAFR